MGATKLASFPGEPPRPPPVDVQAQAALPAKQPTRSDSFDEAAAAPLALGAATGAGSLDLAQLQKSVTSPPHGAATTSLLQGFNGLLEVAKDVPEEQKLSRVNDFFNQRFRYVSDQEQFGAPDHWATPVEMMSRGAGDCEDFAIAKYLTLRALGVPESKLRMTHVKALVPGTSSPQAHMVLAYRATTQAEPLVLDNLTEQLLPLSRRRDLAAVYSFNTEGVWVGDTLSDAGPSRLSRWVDVLARARAEGFR
ncbi:MAG: transglutaminase-like cysteine peptidase [Deltaproteobacteria bacterium]|nr:transglutaminase-like cysteine peptidase [Deltaproteobacteria bacterium]